jgi:N-acetylmuramoyl-L-alanine amidase
MKGLRIVLVAVACAAALLASGVAAQTTLRVDGRDLGEARTDLLPGAAYAPIDAIAEGLGARLAAPVGGASAALTLAGHVVVVDVVEQGQDPAVAGAIRRDGVALADLAAIRGDDAVWAPVAPLVRAFGADVAYLPDEGAVVVVTPRPEVDGIELALTGEVETLRLRLSAPTAVLRFDDPALGRSEFVLRRARVAVASSRSGEWMRRVDVIPEADGVRIRVDAPGATLEAIALPDGVGTDLRIRARPREDGAGPVAREAPPRLVLDPGFAAVPSEARAGVLALAQRVAAALRQAGLEVRLTRDDAAPVSVERRLEAAAGADLFVALQLGALAPGEVRLWVLGEADDQAALDLAIRRNAADALRGAGGAEEATDALRREVLLGLVPDLAVGRRAADALASALFQLGGFRAGSVGEAPLAVLAPAAGRGLLIEVAPDDLEGDALVDVLAAALASVASGAR